MRARAAIYTAAQQCRVCNIFHIYKLRLYADARFTMGAFIRCTHVSPIAHVRAFTDVWSTRSRRTRTLVRFLRPRHPVGIEHAPCTGGRESHIAERFHWMRPSQHIILSRFISSKCATRISLYSVQATGRMPNHNGRTGKTDPHYAPKWEGRLSSIGTMLGLFGGHRNCKHITPQQRQNARRV